MLMEFLCFLVCVFLSVFVDDLLSRPVVELERIISFMGYKVDRPAIVAIVPSFLVSLKVELGDSFQPMKDISELDNYEPLGSFDDSVLSVMPPLFVEAGMRSLKDELVSTKQLTVWPCRNFRELDGIAIKQGIDHLMVMKSADVAANCSAPFVKCSVRFDLSGG